MAKQRRKSSRPRFKRELVKRKMIIVDAVSSAFGEFTSLGEEMREAFDNTPESLQQSGAGPAREEAADALEQISEPDVPDILAALEFEHVTQSVPFRQQTRSWRLGEACDMIEQVITRLQEAIEADVALADADAEKKSEMAETAEGFIEELEQAKDEAEQVNFPGMYG